MTATFRPYFFRPQAAPIISALSFPQTVVFSLSSTQNIPATGTICCWARCTTAGNNGSVIEIASGSGIAARFYSETDNKWKFVAGVLTPTDLNISDQSWTFLAATFDTGATGNIYYGTGAAGLTSVGSYTSPSVTPDTFSLYATRSSTLAFAGLIAHAMLFNVVLTQTELEAQYLRGRPRRTSSLVNYIPPFPDAANTKDYSGGGRNMTASGTLTDTGDRPKVTYGT